MTVILPKAYHAEQALKDKGIYCKSNEDAIHQDIRALRIGILNIMPKAQSYEFSLLYPLGRSIIHIEPVWIRLKTHSYSSSSLEHLENLYVTFEDAIKEKNLDGMILTGAPVEDIPFEDVKYWDEIVDIITYAKNNFASTLGICWGGLALAKFIGINKALFREKLFGVFETKNIAPNHFITGQLDDVFWTPQSRHSGICDEVLQKARDNGDINLLAYSDDAGYVIFESYDNKFLIHLGHPEYDTNRLIEEYLRDRDKGRLNVVRPKNLDINKPVNRWRSHGLEFFAQWIKYVYEETPF